MAPPVVFKWPALLVVMRHAQSEANLHRERLERADSPETHVHIATRDVDVPLTDEGRRQATETGRDLPSRNVLFDAGYVSPYPRTLDTPRLVVAALLPQPALT